jgi:hypothetical protein
MEIALIVCALGGVVCATLASAKRRNVLTWFLVGSLIPVVGLILILVLPSLGFDASAGLGRKPEPWRDMSETTVALRTHLESTTLDGITRLVDLRDRGALTPYEFEEKKAELLARIRWSLART